MENLQNRTPAVFFDRDGVVNEDTEYIYKIEDFVYIDGFLDLFESCKKKQYLLFVITNQSGIGRGYYSLEDFLILSDFMQKDLQKRFGFCFDRIYYCAHAPSENCSCRKPKSGMIEQACKDFSVDLSKSYIMGDKESDMLAGLNANINTKILFSPKKVRSKADYVIKSLYEAQTIIQHIKERT